MHTTIHEKEELNYRRLLLCIRMHMARSKWFDVTTIA